MQFSLLPVLILFLTCNLGHAQALQITEFMADPNPVVGLPEAEYIELFNPTGDSVNITSLRVASGGRAVHAGAGSVPLAPGAYLVLVPEEDSAAFSGPGVRVVPMRLPGLSNRGDEITLLLGADTVSQLVYDESWYADDDRDGGGYSLEYSGLGDPTCSGNWRASLHPAGGTPGRSNSVLGQRVDTQAPTVVGAVIDASGVNLMFSEPVVGGVFVSVNGVETEAIPVASRSFILGMPVVKGSVYDLRVFADYSDCAGNFPERDTVLKLLYADEPGSGQLVINELLFNPLPGGSDYLEVYNNGLTAIDLRGTTMSNESSNSRPRTIQHSIILRAGEYLVLTPDPATLLTDFPAADPARIVAFDLPAIPNLSGNLTLTAPSGTVIDAFDYSEEQHAELLSTVEGVSLERVDPDQPTGAAGNWASASSASGFGTPTRRNSQAGTTGANGQLIKLTASTRVFSPDGDGFEDLYVVGYSADRGGAFAKLHVFDLDGRPVSSDSAPRLLGQRGTLTWTGHDAGGEPVPPGPYVVLVEVFTEAGYTLREKLVAVVAPSR